MCAAGMGLCSQLSEHPAIAAESNHLAGVMLMAEHAADEAAVDAVLSASRSLIAVATRSLGAAAQETTIAQYRALAVLASLLRKGLAAPGFARPSCTISPDA